MYYDVIISDPPWSANDKLKMSSTKRGADANYDTLTTDDLCNLEVAKLANPNGCVLVLWVLGSMLVDGMRVMESWGFSQKQVFVWAKSKKDPFKKNKLPNLNDTLGFGMGRIFRQSHEIALIGINNTAIYKKLKNKSQRSVAFDFNEKHSKKPETIQNRLEIMFPHATKENKALELFARRERDGWKCLGNEIGEKEDIRVSIQKIIDENIASK